MTDGPTHLDELAESLRELTARVDMINATPRLATLERQVGALVKRNVDDDERAEASSRRAGEWTDTVEQLGDRLTDLDGGDEALDGVRGGRVSRLEERVDAVVRTLDAGPDNVLARKVADIDDRVAAAAESARGDAWNVGQMSRQVDRLAQDIRVTDARVSRLVERLADERARAVGVETRLERMLEAARERGTAH